MHPPLNKPTTCSFVCACIGLFAQRPERESIRLATNLDSLAGLWCVCVSVCSDNYCANTHIRFNWIQQQQLFGCWTCTSIYSGLILPLPFHTSQVNEWSWLIENACPRSTQLNHSILDGACLKTNMKNMFFSPRYTGRYTIQTLLLWSAQPKKKGFCKVDFVIWNDLKMLLTFWRIQSILVIVCFPLMKTRIACGHPFPFFLNLLLIMMIIIILAEITKEYSWKANWIVRPVCMTTRTQTKA